MYVSDTIKRGTLSKNRKNCLDLIKYQSQETTTRPRPILRFARGPRRKASDEVPTLRLARGPLARGPARKASDEVPILRLARGPARKASDEVPILRLTRGRLCISPAAALTDLPDGVSHPTEELNHSRNVNRTTAQYSGVTDETEVASAPCHLGQDGAGVIDRCAQHCAHN